MLHQECTPKHLQRDRICSAFYPHYVRTTAAAFRSTAAALRTTAAALCLVSFRARRKNARSVKIVWA